MKSKLTSLFFATFLLLASCGNNRIVPEIKDYFIEIPYQNNFRILQLTDLHISDKDDQDLHYRFIDLTIMDANPHLIVVTGDIFTFASKSTAKRLFNYLDSHGVPWTVTFGNHDEQCNFSINWLAQYLSNYGSNCLFKDIANDNVYGNCNFVINLKKNNAVHEQIILLDSNRYNFGSYFGYDYIKQDQIEWYEKIVNYTTEQNGSVVPSIIYCHIPIPEMNEAWEKSQKGDPDAVHEFGEKREKICPPDYNSGLFDMMVSLGSTRAMFFGHDHLNNFCVTYKGISLGYGITSTNRFYHDENLMGGQVVVIHDDHSLTYEQYYHTYDEVR